MLSINITALYFNVETFCLLFWVTKCNKILQVLTTPYVPNTRNPRWDSSIEFFVADFTKVGVH